MPETERNDEAKYYVMADCCTSGNCVGCMHLPVGKKVRRSVMGDKPVTLARADKIKHGWGSYRPTIETKCEERPQ